MWEAGGRGKDGVRAARGQPGRRAPSQGGMEFETISSAPLLDKNGWYQADDPWAGAPLVLRNTKGSADSEGSCTPTDVGTWPTQPSDAGAAVWDSLCAEWDGNQAVTVEAEAGSTSTQHQELSSSSPYELYVLAEQQELW